MGCQGAGTWALANETQLVFLLYGFFVRRGVRVAEGA